MSFIPPSFPAMHGFDVANGTVETDLPCRKCAYNLRGLPAEGRCPECGAPVGMTLGGELLRYANPSWVRTLRNGCIAMLVGMGVAFASIALTIAAVIITQSREISTHLGTIGNFIGGVIVACGVWMITSPQPSSIGADALATTRKVIRILLIIGLFSGGLGTVATVPSVPETMKATLLWVTIGMGILTLIGQVAQLHYIEDVAMRIPNALLSKRADFLKLAMPAATAFVLILTAISRFFITPAPEISAQAAIGFGCLSGVVGIVSLVLKILYIVMLINLAIEFGREAQLATENAAPPPIALPAS